MGKGKKQVLDARAATGVLLAALVLVAPGRQLPPVSAQAAAKIMTTSGAEDTAALLEAKAAADTSACHDGDYLGSTGTCPLDTWTADTEPCGDGHDSQFRG